MRHHVGDERFGGHPWLWAWEEWPKNDYLEQVAASGPEGAVLLAEQVRERTKWPRVLFIAALGDATGDAGIAELRKAAAETGPGTVDTRCAALLALTRRLHELATPHLLVGLSDRNRSVRDYPLLGLAAYGDFSAWDAVLSELANRIKRPSKIEQHAPSEAVAVCYLIRMADDEALAPAIDLLRTAWPRIAPSIRHEIERFWPSVVPGAPISGPDRAAARSWFVSRSHLFSELA